jgi:hypothetical protein
LFDSEKNVITRFTDYVFTDGLPDWLRTDYNEM